MIVNLVNPRNLLLLALVACSGKAAPPSPEDYKKLDPKARCEAMTPRATKCISHLMVEELKSTGMTGSEAKDMMRQVDEKPSKPGDDDKAFEVMCLGEKDPNAVPDAVYACWKIESCSLFAKCVTEHTTKLRQ